MSFYTFSQNNSGGDFIVDDDVAEYVIIEADNGNEALNIAENVGLYFNGVSEGIDCSCCGDRWSTCYSKYDEPMIWGNKDLIAELKDTWSYKSAIIYYKNDKKTILSNNGGNVIETHYIWTNGIWEVNKSEGSS